MSQVHRPMPASDEAEKSVLGCITLAPDYTFGLCEERGVTAEFFHIAAHAEIFRALMKLRDDRTPIDIVTVTQRLHNDGRLEHIGGGNMVSTIFFYLPTAANLPHYLETLVEKHQRRELIRVTNDFGQRAYVESEDIGGVLEEAEKEILAVRAVEMGDTSDGSTNWVMDAISDIQALYERRGAITGLSTGLPDLDKMLDGLHSQEMVVIAARPSMGKTALGMNIAEHIAVDQKKPVAVFSLEMSARQLRQRLLCARAKINLTRVRDGFLSDRDFQEMSRVGTQLKEAKILIDDRSGLSIQQLRGKARRMKREHGIEAIVVDYLQLLRSSSARAAKDRQLEITEISGGLKQMAKELEIPVIVLAQLNRAAENRKGDAKGKPRLSDLRESGSIEQDADVVALLMRDEYYADSDEEKRKLAGRATLTIAKQRNGPTGDVHLTFLKEFTRFETRIDGPEEEEPKPKSKEPRRDLYAR